MSWTGADGLGGEGEPSGVACDDKRMVWTAGPRVVDRDLLTHLLAYLLVYRCLYAKG